MSRPLKKHLELEGLFGADFLPLSKTAKRPSKKPARHPGPDISAWGWPSEYLAFREEVLDCRKCGLCATRTQVVFGVGPLSTPLLFVGEAPGADEDVRGEPFVGRAGQLLTSTLKKLGVERHRVHIANILKCRPPDNRTPQPDEMQACLPWLQRQIDTIRPKVLCAMGNIAAQTLLQTKTGITRLRGRSVEAMGTRIFPTFHPAYILRNMGDLPLFEADLRTVCKETGLLEK